MPRLAETISSGDIAGYTRITPPHAPTLPVIFQSLQYPQNPDIFLRCPLPSSTASPDALRQYFNNATVPQTRLVAPSVLNIKGT